jgi:hypothetical protein
VHRIPHRSSRKSAWLHRPKPDKSNGNDSLQSQLNGSVQGATLLLKKSVIIIYEAHMARAPSCFKKIFDDREFGCKTTGASDFRNPATAPGFM